jgi:hypothetical protein
MQTASIETCDVQTNEKKESQGPKLRREALRADLWVWSLWRRSSRRCFKGS